jgi:uncharacterized protein YxjI
MSTALTVPQRYVAQAALFNFMGRAFHIYDTDGRLQFYIKQKAFRLKEAIKVYADEGETQQRLSIQARAVLDFNTTYDVHDSTTGEHLGAARRKGMKSLFKDEWEVLSPAGEVVGLVEETGGILSILRRLIDALKFIPQKYAVSIGGQHEGTIDQRFAFFRQTYDVDFTPGSGLLDPRMGVALTVLLLAIESRQDG